MNERAVATDAEREASRWLVRLESRDVSLDDHRRFRAWLADSDENRTAYEAVSATWDRLDTLKLLQRTQARSHRHCVSRRALLWAGGVSSVVAASTIGIWLATPATTYAANFTTSIGGRETATLEDGSEIQLNADSAVRVAFTDRRRAVVLARGEALFRVAPDLRPFDVRTPYGGVSASDGAFLVKLTDALTRASVIDGEVRASPAHGQALIALAGQQIILRRDSAEATPLSQARSAEQLAWREGMLAFSGEPLREAVLDVQRQTGVVFRFSDPTIGEMTIGGYIDARDEAAFISLLETNLDLRARRNRDGVIILSWR